MTSEYERSAGARRFHLAIWRWHFYAGLFVLPLTLLLALSGLAWTPFWGGQFVQTWSSLPVHWPRGDRGAWTVASTTIAGDTQQPGGDRVVHLDPATGEVLAEIRYSDYSPMGRFMAAGIPLHQADLGITNVFANILLCIAVIGMSVAALTAWWMRRLTGVRRLVPPPLPADMRVWHGAIALMLALSLAFPLAAATLLTVLALDTLLLSRTPALKAWFQ